MQPSMHPDEITMQEHNGLWYSKVPRRIAGPGICPLNGPISLGGGSPVIRDHLNERTSCRRGRSRRDITFVTLFRVSRATSPAGALQCLDKAKLMVTQRINNADRAQITEYRFKQKGKVDKKEVQANYLLMSFSAFSPTCLSRTTPLTGIIGASMIGARETEFARSNGDT